MVHVRILSVGLANDAELELLDVLEEFVGLLLDLHAFLVPLADLGRVHPIGGLQFLQRFAVAIGGRSGGFAQAFLHQLEPAEHL